jgi:hypothetical protein
MEIRDGEMAWIANARMKESHDQTEIEQTRKALLEYCGLDPYYVMVKLFEALKTYLR